MDAASATPAPGTAPRRWPYVLLAIFQIALFAGVLTLYRLPSSEPARIVDLAGSWRAQRGSTPALAAPDLDEARWATVTLPGTPAAQGLAGRSVWLRRHFVLPPGLRERDLALLAGNGGSNGIEIYVNGTRIGDTPRFARGETTELYGASLWHVPRAALVPEGANVIALRLWSQTPEEPGLRDGRVLLGEHDWLRAQYAREFDARRLIAYGTIAVLSFTLALLALLFVLESTEQTRGLYIATMSMGGAGLLYVVVNAGGLLPLEQSSPHTFAAAFTVPALFGATYVPFLEIYLRGRLGPIGRLGAAGSGLYLLLALGAWALGRFDVIMAAYFGFGLWILCGGLYALGLAAHACWRGVPASAPALLAAAVVLFLSNVSDILVDLNLWHAPWLSTAGGGVVTVMASTVVIGDFVRISFVNRQLAAALRSTNADLSVALSAAQQAARAKGEFVANVSHELRTPLNAIINIPPALIADFAPQSAATCRACGARFALDAGEALAPDAPCPDCGTVALAPGQTWAFAGDPSEARRHLGTLERAGNHLKHLVDGVLEFSKLESGRMALTLEPVDLAAALREAAETFAPYARERGVAVAIECADEARRLYADPTRLQQILLNLVGNALKFSPRGGTVTLGARSVAGARVIAVRDDGPGIAPADQAAIFESFHQVDGSQTRAHGGTGLGLAICRQLVELHGGRIWVESQLGAGSVFYVSLPAEGPEGSRPTSGGVA